MFWEAAATKEGNENLIRIWFGAVRDAADAGEAELREGVALSALQRAKLRILLRQEGCDLLSLVIRSVEGVNGQTANQIWEIMYSELMEDAIAGVWNETESMELARFLSLCTEGIGGAEDFCAYFGMILGDILLPSPARDERNALALRVKDRADKALDAFIRARMKQTRKNDRTMDGPPPGMDEFEYIDWVMTH